MGQGLRIARVLGVPVYLSPSWFLFALLVVVSYGPLLTPRFGTASAYAAAVSYAVLLLVSVLLHEVAHCVVARSFDLPVRSITVTFLAGLTEITSPPQTPAREYAVAVSGPMVSLLLAGTGYAAAQALPDASLAAFIVGGAAVINGAVAVFNLLPGLPLDGGRVLRAIAWRLTGDGARATRFAAQAGRLVAVLVVPLVAGLFTLFGLGVPTLGSLLFTVLVAGFIYSGATASLRAAQVQARLPEVGVAQLARPALGVPADLPVAEAVRRAQGQGYRGLVIVDSADRPAALVSEAAVAATPEQRRPWVAVGSLARQLEPGLVLDPYLSGEPLLAAVQRTPATEYLVHGPDGRLYVLAGQDVARALHPADRPAEQPSR